MRQAWFEGSLRWFCDKGAQVGPACDVVLVVYTGFEYPSIDLAQLPYCS